IHRGRHRRFATGREGSTRPAPAITHRASSGHEHFFTEGLWLQPVNFASLLKYAGGRFAINSDGNPHDRSSIELPTNDHTSARTAIGIHCREASVHSAIRSVSNIAR
ncbi:MAG: hypothetical protein O3B13_04425, partial [Planctomycetota bacterium]|nr:hypothetical protein [Planctomycetota bacterium]